MSSLNDDIISGVIGAVAGGVAGALTGWFVAPTQAEREERGRKRVEGRSQIASAVANLNYQLTEARGKLFRLEETGNLLARARFLEFANAVKRGSAFLHRLARFRVERRAKKLTGRLIWRLAEIVPPEHYDEVDEASIRQATADTRTSTDKLIYGPALAKCSPTNTKWDEALRILDKMRKAYPSLYSGRCRSSSLKQHDPQSLFCAWRMLYRIGPWLVLNPFDHLIPCPAR